MQWDLSAVMLRKKKKNDRKQAILENGVWALIGIAYLLKYNLKFSVGSASPRTHNFDSLLVPHFTVIVSS